MAQMEIRLPKMGESVTEATITNWLKNIGDSVAMDEPLVEVATDKVDNELPSEAEGILVKIFFEKDQVAQVGDVTGLPVNQTFSGLCGALIFLLPFTKIQACSARKCVRRGNWLVV